MHIHAQDVEVVGRNELGAERDRAVRLVHGDAHGAPGRHPGEGPGLLLVLEIAQVPEISSGIA